MNDRLLSIPPSLRQRPALCSPARLARRANTLALLVPLLALAPSTGSGQAPVTPGKRAGTPPAVRPTKVNAAARAHVPPAPAFARPAGLDPQVLDLAVGAASCAIAASVVGAPRTLSVIDYSRPSTEPRLWVFDLASGALLYEELVAHGRNTGDNLATRFSNELNSRQTSIGLFVTGGTYTGSNGYSLRLRGLEPGVNDRAMERAIVMHGAPYVSRETVSTLGRLGRSWGCPAVRQPVARELIDEIKGGGLLFSYYPDGQWLRASPFLGGCSAAGTTT